MSSITRLRLDYEGKSDTDLKQHGLHRYTTCPTSKPLMAAWAWNDEDDIEHADFTRGDRLPPEVKDALLDPHVEKWAFNAAFERLYTKHVMGINTPVKGWRCTMVLGFMRSFTGGLEEMGRQLGLPSALVKDPVGSRLIRKFCMPQKITKTNPHLWRDHTTDPDDWALFCGYNIRDVRAEDAIYSKIIDYPTLESEWRLYEIDQIINDRGLPVDMQFVQNAGLMSFRRKEELREMMNEATGLRNANSTQQLIPWLQFRGYPFADLKKLTVKKVLVENKLKDDDDIEKLPAQAVSVLKLRQQASRTSVRKYVAIEKRVSPDNFLRHCFQFAGAARTNRWSGRGPQPQNLVRTPKEYGDLVKLLAMIEAIRNNDYDMVGILTVEQMDALAGILRSSFAAPEGYEFVVCDLSAIESAVIAWLSACTRMLNVFRDGRDPYKDFGVDLYRKIYEEVTSEERGVCKPAVLGCGFGLGGGKLIEGKRTGLWGYAEGMGVDLSNEEAHKQVDVFRSIYSEIPQFWKAMEDATKKACRGETVDYEGKLAFKKKGPFMMMQLPSGRQMYYHQPKMKTMQFKANDGRPYSVKKFTCMGISQVTKRWQRISSGGPKICENAVQATAREVLAAGMRRAHKAKFNIVGSVHDELIVLRKIGDERFSLENLRQCMVEKDFWMSDLPLKAAGYVSRIYRKD